MVILSDRGYRSCQPLKSCFLTTSSVQFSSVQWQYFLSRKSYNRKLWRLRWRIIAAQIRLSLKLANELSNCQWRVVEFLADGPAAGKLRSQKFRQCASVSHHCTARIGGAQLWPTIISHVVIVANDATACRRSRDAKVPVRPPVRPVRSTAALLTARRGRRRVRASRPPTDSRHWLFTTFAQYQYFKYQQNPCSVTIIHDSHISGPSPFEYSWTTKSIRSAQTSDDASAYRASIDILMQFRKKTFPFAQY